MESTRRLEIDLPTALADEVQARVESGEFADASEVVATGLALLEDSVRSFRPKSIVGEEVRRGALPEPRTSFFEDSGRKAIDFAATHRDPLADPDRFSTDCIQDRNPTLCVARKPRVGRPHDRRGSQHKASAL
jgi:Arc/MetJ-type ribon-helix-helix transcriptional regulator